MFDALTDRLTGVFDGLTGRGALSEKDVSNAMREIRVALLEADVALPVVKDFIAKVKEQAVGESVIKSITPGQMVIKIVHDELVEMLGGEDSDTKLKIDSPPAVIMMAGLQGSGKTTTTGKLAKRLKDKERKKVLLASLDVRRPAAQQQLKVLGEQVGVNTLPIIAGQMPVDIAKRAMQAGKLGGYDVVMLDTAGRTSIDEGLMAEARSVRDAVNPHEVLLVLDAGTGQNAINQAKQFNQTVSLTGLALTKLDGTAKGGVIFALAKQFGLPIRYIGVGEGIDDLRTFEAEPFVQALFAERERT